MFGTKRFCFILFLAVIVAFSFASVGATKNIINVYMWEIKDWDPHICYSDGVRLLTNIYEPLLLYDDGKLIPVLATSYEKSPDAKTWTFKLRQGVKFHNGEPFNAQAVKYSYERVVKMGQGPAWIYEPIKEIKIIDDYTIQFICEEPQPVDLMVSAYYGSYIMPPKLTEEKGSDWFQKGNAVGTGPYKLVSYEKGAQAVVEKFDDYWGGWKSNQFDIAVYKIISESSTAIQLLKRGEMDIIEAVPMEMEASLKAHPDIEAVYGESVQNRWYNLHTQKPPTDDINVRKAIIHAINVDEMIDKIIGTTAIRAFGPIPYALWGHDSSLKRYDYSPEKAKALLRQSKYADQWEKGELKVTVTAYDEGTLAPATYIQAALKKIGIQAEIDSTPWPASWDTYKNKEKCPQVTVLDWWADYPTPSGWLYAWFVEEEPLFNWSYYSNPEYENTVNEAKSLEATDRDKAAKLYSKAQQMLLDDAAAVFSVDFKNLVFIRKGIKGFRHLPIYNGAYWIYRLHK